MLKLLIVDDEEMICNTIANLIDWSSLEINLIGTCMDGVDAYHTILDESPEIVMTDIRMPGISGLELIERINSRGSYTQFIILSGHGEFEYAKRAMKSGVRHYLLKPCDEHQIIDCIKEIVTDCTKISLTSSSTSSNLMAEDIQHTLILNIIREGMSLPDLSADFFLFYSHYLNLTDIPYQYCCFYYLLEQNLGVLTSQISNYFANIMPQHKIYPIYVRNTLIVFFPNFDSDYSKMDHHFETLSVPVQTTSVVYERTSYADLQSLLNMLIPKLKRYDIINFINGQQSLPYFNYGNILYRFNQLVPLLLTNESPVSEKALHELTEIMTSISSIDFLIQLSDNLIIFLVTQSEHYTLSDITGFLYSLHQEVEINTIREASLQKVAEILAGSDTQTQYSAFIEKLIAYLSDHLSDQNLTLKWIAENYLYMNVNYVSRCFLKETGQKFSNYLMNLRVQKAIELFSLQDNEKIQNIAEIVGCGNNPYYFSKIFKKCTGMTPSSYVRKLQKHNKHVTVTK